MHRLTALMSCKADVQADKAGSHLLGWHTAVVLDLAWLGSDLAWGFAGMPSSWRQAASNTMFSAETVGRGWHR